ncbi:hypothetical protein ES702_00131 [subsurface metagenome]
MLVSATMHNPQLGPFRREVLKTPDADTNVHLKKEDWACTNPECISDHTRQGQR